MLKQKIMNNSLIITYQKGIFNNADIKELECSLENAEIKLIAYEHPPRIINGIEELIPLIMFGLSPDIANAIMLGVATNFVYDAVKQFLMAVYQKLTYKKLFKMSNGKIKENNKNPIQFIIGKNRVILPTDIDEEKYKYFVDNFFEMIDKDKFQEEYFCYYNEKSCTFMYYTEEEVIMNSRFNNLHNK